VSREPADSSQFQKQNQEAYKEQLKAITKS
jgi:hypothetical protein